MSFAFIASDDCRRLAVSLSMKELHQDLWAQTCFVDISEPRTNHQVTRNTFGVGVFGRVLCAALVQHVLGGPVRLVSVWPVKFCGVVLSAVTSLVILESVRSGHINGSNLLVT